MKSEIFRIEVPAFIVGMVLRALKACGVVNIEPVAHRTEDDILLECAPPPDGYHVEVSEEFGSPSYFAIFGIQTLGDGGRDGELVFPPEGSLLWRDGSWKETVSYPEYLRRLEEERAEEEFREQIESFEFAEYFDDEEFAHDRLGDHPADPWYQPPVSRDRY